MRRLEGEKSRVTRLFLRPHGVVIQEVQKKLSIGLYSRVHLSKLKGSRKEIMTTKKNIYSREEILRQAEKKGYANERDYHGCSQSVLGALQDVFEMRADNVFRAASGLGGGVGLTAETCCGGLTGGCMFLSQLCGRKRELDGSFGDEENRRFKAYKYCQFLAMHFFEEYDACNCFEIQKQKMDGRSYVLAETSQFEEFINQGGHSHVCPEVIGKAARWTAEIVLDNLEDLGLKDKIN